MLRDRPIPRIGAYADAFRPADHFWTCLGVVSAIVAIVAVLVAVSL
jgi:hypothetical protein